MIISLILEVITLQPINWYEKIGVTSLSAHFGLIASIAGVIFSFAAFYQAKKAKKAAYLAGKIVRTQEIIIELERIIHISEFDEEIKYYEANKRLNEFGGRIYGIVGLLKNDDASKGQLQLIQESLSLIRTTLESANPIATNNIYSEGLDQQTKDTIIYCLTSPHLSTLIQNLSILKGNLQEFFNPQPAIKNNGK